MSVNTPDNAALSVIPLKPAILETVAVQVKQTRRVSFKAAILDAPCPERKSTGKNRRKAWFTPFTIYYSGNSTSEHTTSSGLQCAKSLIVTFISRSP